MRTTTLALLILCGAGAAIAQYDYGFTFTKAGSAGYQSLKIGVGAREVAMGEAASAVTTSAASVFWNPGALALVERSEVLFSHTAWINGSRQEAAVAAVPVGSYVVALSAMQFAIEEFEETTVQAPNGTGRMVSAGDLVLGLAVARRFTDKLTIGLQAKYFRETLDDFAFGNVMFDIGTVYHTGFHNLRLAFALQHFGPDKKLLKTDFRTPLLFRLGVAEDFLKADDHRFTVALDLIHPTDNTEWVNIGVELELLKMFAVRGGYRLLADEGNLTLGAGVLSPELGPVALGLDYAYASFGSVLGATHRISLTVGF
jgi:hypothetical protein